MFYALIKHWEDSGKPVHAGPFFDRHVASAPEKKGWGTNVIESDDRFTSKTTRHAIRLDQIIRSKDDRIEDGVMLKEHRSFTSCPELRIVRARSGWAITTKRSDTFNLTITF